jgi:hypothetical protein
MACVWKNTEYSNPPTGKHIVVKYNGFRSDTPFAYIAAIYEEGWKQEILDNSGKFRLRTIPKPDWWAYIEGDDEHE